MYVTLSTAPVIFWSKSLVYSKLTGWSYSGVLLISQMGCSFLLCRLLEFMVWPLLSHFACNHAGIVICYLASFPLSYAVFRSYVYSTQLWSLVSWSFDMFCDLSVGASNYWYWTYHSNFKFVAVIFSLLILSLYPSWVDFIWRLNLVLSLPF